MITVNIDNMSFKCLLDSGAGCSLIEANALQSLGRSSEPCCMFLKMDSEDCIM